MNKNYHLITHMFQLQSYQKLVSLCTSTMYILLSDLKLTQFVKCTGDFTWHI